MSSRDSGHQRIPIIKLWQLLLVPLQGTMTDSLAAQLTTEVLDRIHVEGSSGLVIDITGLWVVDSHLCAVLSHLSSAASLMGARTLISGMKPEIALTLETMGVDLVGVRTTLNLEGALRLLGVRPPDDVEPTSEGAATIRGNYVDEEPSHLLEAGPRTAQTLVNGGHHG
jgi:rsbT antagonist protein RsbS